jgi:hypothetical protein
MISFRHYLNLASVMLDQFTYIQIMFNEQCVRKDFNQYIVGCSISRVDDYSNKCSRYIRRLKKQITIGLANVNVYNGNMSQCSNNSSDSGCWTNGADLLNTSEQYEHDESNISSNNHACPSAAEIFCDQCKRLFCYSCFSSSHTNSENPMSHSATPLSRYNLNDHICLEHDCTELSYYNMSYRDLICPHCVMKAKYSTQPYSTLMSKQKKASLLSSYIQLSEKTRERIDNSLESIQEQIDCDDRVDTILTLKRIIHVSHLNIFVY